MEQISNNQIGHTQVASSFLKQRSQEVTSWKDTQIETKTEMINYCQYAREWQSQTQHTHVKYVEFNFCTY